MLRNFAPDVTAAWAPVMPLELELVKQETNPRMVQFGAPQESVVVCKFTVEFAARSGAINWLLPDALLTPIRETLSGEGGGPSARKQEPWGPALGAALKEAQLDTRAVLAEAQISLGELVQLSPGDIIPIDAPLEATLLVGDVPLYQGRFGVSQGRNALKILSGASR
jgi:flagellar motor switch protein FliM